MLAAAAVLAVAIWNQNTPATAIPLVAPQTATRVTESIDENTVSQTSLRLADIEARSEFAELDAAAVEIEAALNAAPNNTKLRTYLSTVRSRRDELARRVTRATS